MWIPEAYLTHAGAMGTTPIPDPTVLTTEAQERADRAAREWVESQLAVRDERLERLDLATSLRAESVAKDIEHAQELARKDDAHQSAMSDMRFAERDFRTAEAATAAATAISAAFSAQKEAAQKQDENNQKSRDRQEENTEKALAKLGDLFQTTFENLREGLAEVKLRVNSSEFSRQGANERRDESRAGVGAWVGIGGFILALLAFVVMAYSVSRTPDVSVAPDQAPVVTVTVPTGG